MIIRSVRVRNFRSIRDETLSCRRLTALVGRNGSGKSSFLNALDLFYSSTDQVSEDDFYNGDTSEDIVVEVTFDQLSDKARDLFAKRVHDGKLVVEKVIAWDSGRPNATYHGVALRNPDFEGIRRGFQIRDRGRTAKDALKELRDSGKYDGLPEWSTIDGTKQALIDWEEQHSELCEKARDDGQFFGFRQVAEGYLGRFTRRLYIPAVRDAPSDAVEGRGSIFTDLMDLVVRRALAEKEGVRELQQRISEEYARLVDPDNLPELGVLASQLSSTLQTFVPNAGVQLSWLPLGEPEIPTPRADMKLVEDGYASPVDRCGHGLQRAFIVTMLQHVALARTGEPGSESDAEDGETEATGLPNLVLLIEEPELYQHPNRQRHFARILKHLAQGRVPGVADETQIIYSTHSPYFVGIDRIDQVRLLRKVEMRDGLPKVTQVVQTSLDEIAGRLWRVAGEPGSEFTGDTLAPRLTSIMTPWMNEGFFADLAVLVEGEDDRAAILGMAQVIDVDLESRGISVIPCGGKTNLDRPAVIFRELGIPVYLIWDSDKGNSSGKAEHNHALLRLSGADLEDWPSTVDSQYACFECDLETTLKEELGRDFYEAVLADCQERFGIPKKKHAMKNPNIVAELITEAERNGRECQTLRRIVEQILQALPEHDYWGRVPQLTSLDSDK